MPNKESNLLTQTTMATSDLVRIVSNQASRSINLANFATTIKPLIGNISQTRVIRTTATNYGPVAADDVILVDTASADVTINIPLASSMYDSGTSAGQLFTIKKIDSSSANKVIINRSGSDLIDGSTALNLIGSDRPFVNITTDGSNWWTV
jgi:hypothetical protein